MSGLDLIGAQVVVAEVERDGEGRTRVLAPRVGWWSDHPRAGTLLGRRGVIGSLETLNRRFRLVLPEGVTGRLSGRLPTDRRVAVGYRDLLFQLAPVETAETPEAPSGGPGRSGAPGLGEGQRAVVSPTDGVFYRRPSPDAPPFVLPGSRVRTGQPVGLVETMKTFNQVLYGGPDFPEEAEVVEIPCEDLQEVRAGQVLVVVR